MVGGNLHSNLTSMHLSNFVLWNLLCVYHLLMLTETWDSFMLRLH